MKKPDVFDMTNYHSSYKPYANIKKLLLHLIATENTAEIECRGISWRDFVGFWVEKTGKDPYHYTGLYSILEPFYYGEECYSCVVNYLAEKNPPYVVLRVLSVAQWSREKRELMVKIMNSQFYKDYKAHGGAYVAKKYMRFSSDDPYEIVTKVTVGDLDNDNWDEDEDDIDRPIVDVNNIDDNVVGNIKKKS